MSNEKISLAGAATNILFVATKVSSRQSYFCGDKHVFVAIKVSKCHKCFVPTKMFVEAKVLSRQK